MPDGLGHMSKAGIKDCSSWGEAWAAVDELIPFNSESINQNIEMIENMGLEGSASKIAPDLGLIKIPGDWELDFDYYYPGTLLEHAFGAVSTGVYTFTDAFAKIFRMEIDKQVSRWRFDGVMIDTLELSGRAGEIWKMRLGLVCRSITRSATAFPSLSIANRSRMRFSNSSSNSYFRLADLGDALAAGDKMEMSEITFRINNNLTKDLAGNQQRTILQPRRGGFREVSLSITAPIYTADTIPAWKDAGTTLQADIYNTDGTKTFKLELPEMLITSGFGAPVESAGVLSLQGELGCYRNLTNTNMAAISDEARITIT